MDNDVVRTIAEETAKRCNMPKTIEELRAASRERVRRYRARQAIKSTKYVDRVRIVQFIITFRLPVVNVRRISFNSIRRSK